MSKVSITLDAGVAERARADIAAGKAPSLSAWLNEAARARVEQDDLAGVLAEIFDASGGPATDAEISHAYERLAAARWR